MAGYVVQGIGFGILLRKAGFGLGYALPMSLFIYAGSMQYVGVSLLAGGVSVLSATVLRSERHGHQCAVQRLDLAGAGHRNAHGSNEGTSTGAFIDWINDICGK